LKVAEDYLKAHPRPNCEGVEKRCIIPELEKFMTEGRAPTV
jgi:hypothetical protein